MSERPLSVGPMVPINNTAMQPELLSKSWARARSRSSRLALDSVNERLQTFVSPAGIRVGVLSVDELAAITCEDIARRARHVMKPGIDTVFIACSQLPSEAILLDLEEELGVPVWPSIRASALQAMRTAGTA